MKRILLAFLIGLFSLPACGQYTKLSGFCEDGNQTVTTQGLTSTTLVQRSFPLCTVTVYNAGTGVVATIYANSAGMALGNPFTAATDGQWGFYGTPASRYDTTFSGGGITTPFTRADWVAPSIAAGTGSVCNYAANQLVCEVGGVPPADVLIDNAVNSFPGDTGVGNAALRNILAGGGFSSVGVGFQAGTAITSGYQDTLIGYQAGLALTTGYQSIGIGDNALTATTGFQNTVVGSGAGNTITTGNQNALFGYNTQTSAATIQATAVGTGAAVTGNGGTALGRTTSAQGTTSLAIGNAAIASNTNSIAIGTNTTTSGAGAVAIGAAIATASATNCVALGTGSTCSVANQVNMAMPSTAYQVGIGIINNSNTDKLWVFGDIRIGSSGTNGCLKGFGGATLVGTCVSDRRLKQDIQPLAPVLSKLMQIRPVSYRWRQEVEPGYGFGKESVIGVIAQDVQKVFPGLVSPDDHGYLAVNTAVFPYLLLQAIRELQDEIGQLRKQLDARK